MKKYITVHGFDYTFLKFRVLFNLFSNGLGIYKFIKPTRNNVVLNFVSWFWFIRRACDNSSFIGRACCNSSFIFSNWCNNPLICLQASKDCIFLNCKGLSTLCTPYNSTLWAEQTGALELLHYVESGKGSHHFSVLYATLHCFFTSDSFQDLNPWDHRKK